MKRTELSLPFFLLILTLTAAPAVLFGEDPRVITVDQAVSLARQDNLNLQTKALEAETKKRTRDTAWNRFLPQVSASASLTRMTEDQDQTVSGLAPVPPAVGGTYDRVAPYEEEIELSQWNLSPKVQATLPLTPALFHGIQMTRKDYQAGLISREKAEAQLERDVRKLFYNLLLFERNIEITKQSIQTAADRYEQARINYQNGLIPRYQMLSAQVALENQKPGLEDQKIQYQSMLAQFRQLLGLPRGTAVQLQGDISVDPAQWKSDPLIRDFLEINLDIQSMENTLEILHLQKQLENDSRLPSLTLMYTLDPGAINDPFGADWTDGDNWQQKNGMLNISLSVPLDGWIPSSSTDVGVKNAQDNLEKTRMGLTQTREQLAMQVENIVRELNKSRQTLEARKLNVELAEESYTLAEEAYRAGGKELLEVQNAEIELQNARLGVLQERLNYINQLLELEYLLHTDRETLKECCRE